jgi:ComF family protein
MTGQVQIAAHTKASPMEGLRHALAFARDLLLPPVCPVCREPVTGSGGLCGRCWAKLSFIPVSVRAIADPPAYGRARAAVRYDDIARTLVHALKYGDRLELAPTMGRWMAHAGRELLADADALVPAPLHWRRLWTRRFNQAALLAQAISQSGNLPVWHAALRRVRATPQQIGLPRVERASNVQAAFRVPEQAKTMIRGKRIVLVDDVLTSGATVDACARALFRGGALGVDVLVFACVVDATP